jgi:hypothetical protein
LADHATNKQPERDPASAAKKRREPRNRNDIVGRTTLELPSLSGLEPMPLFPPKQEPAAAPHIDAATSSPTVPAPKEQTIVPAEPPTDATNKPPVPLPQTTDARLRAVPARPVANQSQQTAGLSLKEITGQTITGQTTSHPLKRIRLRPLLKALKAGLMLALLCIIIGGAFAYFYVSTIAPQTTTAITLHQRASPTGQRSDATPGGSSIAVGDHPIIELQGYRGNVSIATGQAGSIFIKTSSDQTANADNLHYTKSRDEQGHDLIHIINQTINQSINYEILSPRATEVRVTIDAGSIAIAGISGVTIISTNGSISVQDTTGPTNITTRNGDITLNNVKGAMTVQTSSGSIRGNTLDGQLKATTRNGDIIVRHGTLHDQSQLQTQQGSITYTGTITTKGDYKMSTQSGNVTLTLPASTAMQLHASIHSGTLSNAFRPANGSLAQVSINVGSGSIIVKKAT